MNFDLPGHLPPLLERMDAFIEAEIMPLQARYPQFFDERREFARTDLDRGGLPSRQWEELLTRMRAVADAAGWLRYGLPASLGGQDGTNLDMAVIREHLAARGLGLHNEPAAGAARPGPGAWPERRPGCPCRPCCAPATMPAPSAAGT